jgi:hypothetical protein
MILLTRQVVNSTRASVFNCDGPTSLSNRVKVA